LTAFSEGLLNAFGGANQLGGLDVKRSRQDLDVQEAHVPLAALDASNVSAMKPADVCKSFLAEARPLSQHSKRDTE